MDVKGFPAWIPPWNAFRGVLQFFAPTSPFSLGDPKFPAFWVFSLLGDFLTGGFHTPVRGTMFVRDGAVTPGPSRECDIAFFVKQRPKSAQQSRDSTVAARRVRSVTVPSSRVSRECRSPGLRSPPLKIPDLRWNQEWKNWPGPV